MKLVDRLGSPGLEIATWAAVSRLYTGIHFAFDNEDGLASGQCIGQAINERVRFSNGDDG